MTKIRVHIDPKGYDEKPSGKEIGGIKSRLQKGTRPSLVTLEELVQKIRTGHSISPGIMEGMSAKNWKEQQLFMVDIDNEEDGPILRIKDARAICHDNAKRDWKHNEVVHKAMHRSLDDCLFDMFEEMGVVIDKSNIDMLDLIIDETMKVAVARY